MKITWQGGSRTQLWDGRWVEPGASVDVSDDQANELLSRGGWTAEGDRDINQAADTPMDEEE